MDGWIQARSWTARRLARRSAERRRIRVWDSVRHAQAQGLARRIQRAAKLRPRHRAKTKSSKDAFCRAILYLCTICERMQLNVWRIENLCIEGPKSRSGGSKIEVQRVQNRGLEGFLAALGAAGRSCDHPEGVVVRLGGVLEPLLGGSWAVLGARLGRPRAS